jgi:CRISPR-associated protein Cas2
MNNPQTVWIVAYDIADPARLRRVYRTMRGFGDHLQYSVFRCTLTDRQLATLKDRLTQVIAPTEDQVMFVPLGSPEADRTWRYWTLGLPIVHPERVVRIL